LLAVLGFFTLAATKLPSYWIPATPAAGLLIALTAQQLSARASQRRSRAVVVAALALQAFFAVGLAASDRWVLLINEPELPTLPAELLISGLLTRAAVCFGLACAAGLLLWCTAGPRRWAWLLGQQLALVAFVVAALQPLVALGDRLRQLPVRRIAQREEGDVTLVGDGITSSAGSVINATAGDVLLDGNCSLQGAITLAGSVLTTSNTPTAMRVVDATTLTFANITTGSTGTTTTLSSARLIPTLSSLPRSFTTMRSLGCASPSPTDSG
jgi:hypothetical protein